MTLWRGAGNCRSLERNQSFLFPTDVLHLSGGKCLVRLGANYSSALATNPSPNFDQFLLKSVRRPVKLLLLSVSAPCSSSPRVSIYVAASETLFLNCGTLGCFNFPALLPASALGTTHLLAHACPCLDGSINWFSHL